MQIALDAKTNDLILARTQYGELIGDTDFIYPIHSPPNTTDSWSDVVDLGFAYTLSGQLFLDALIGNMVIAGIESPVDLVRGMIVEVIIDVAVGDETIISVGGNENTFYGTGVHTANLTLADVDSNSIRIAALSHDVVVNSIHVNGYTSDGIRRVGDGRYTIQLVKNKLSTVLGEWLLDPRIGWLNLTDFERGYDLFDIELRARSIITNTPNVKEILNMDLKVKDRKLTMTFTATTTFGIIDLTIPWSV